MRDAQLVNRVTYAHLIRTLTRKTGKQIVYHALQVSLPCPLLFTIPPSHHLTFPHTDPLQNPEDGISPEQITALDITITSLRASTANALTTSKTLRSTLSSLNSTLSTTDLVFSVSALETEKAEILDRLETLKAGKAKKVTKKEREEIEGSWRKWKTVTVKRERISKEMWSMIADALPDDEKKAETREALGLDD